MNYIIEEIEKTGKIKISNNKKDDILQFFRESNMRVMICDVSKLSDVKQEGEEESERKRAKSLIQVFIQSGSKKEIARPHPNVIIYQKMEEINDFVSKTNEIELNVRCVCDENLNLNLVCFKENN